MQSEQSLDSIVQVLTLSVQMQGLKSARWFVNSDDKLNELLREGGAGLLVALLDSTSPGAL